MSVFRFKHFSVQQQNSALKVGTDAMILGASVDNHNVKSVLDIGAGTGVLSLMMAQKFPQAKITAIEIDEQASMDCQENFNHSNWAERLQLIQKDFLTWSTSQQFDLIVSNPPFYQSTLLNKNQQEAKAKHENSLPSKQLVKSIGHFLSEKGVVWLIFPWEDFSKWQIHFKENNLFVQREVAVFGKKGKFPNRIIVALKKVDFPSQKSELILRDSNGNYTEQYIRLTEDFHFNDLRR